MSFTPRTRKQKILYGYDIEPRLGDEFAIKYAVDAEAPELPAVTAADNGKYLMTVNGKWDKAYGSSSNVTVFFTITESDDELVVTTTSDYDNVVANLNSGKHIYAQCNIGSSETMYMPLSFRTRSPSSLTFSAVVGVDSDGVTIPAFFQIVFNSDGTCTGKRIALAVQT